MDQSSQLTDCKRFLKRLREKGKSLINFKVAIRVLQEEAFTKGLDDDLIEASMSLLRSINLGAANAVSLIYCMIPKNKINDDEIRKIVPWFLSSNVQVSILFALIQWLIGCWEYQLINKNALCMFYDGFFTAMVSHERLQSRLAQLIYLITRPQDVTRRQVVRLLSKHKNPPKHFLALLSLFKSYKPEFVPEAIQAINVQSTWRPVPESLRVGFEDARDRIILRQAQQTNELFDDRRMFNVFKTKKNQEPLVPSIEYFNIGSNIFNNNKPEKSIFEVYTAAALGKHHSVVKFPANATSLLTSVIGYHLLTYADSNYQQKFMHNLYYTLWRSFIFENGKYTNEEMNKILDMTLEFSRYMQHGIPVVNYFINEYLSCFVDEHHLKLLSLVQWSSVLSATELQDSVLKHLKLKFYSSSLNTKCKIIQTLRILLLNLFVINDTAFQNKSFPFLGQRFADNHAETTRIIQNFATELIVSSLNIHVFNGNVLSESLSFYEQLNILKVCRITPLYLAPPAVIYGCFVTRSCAMLLRLCELLMQYRKDVKKYQSSSSTRIRKLLITYAEDLVSALWYDNCFSNRSANNRFFLKGLEDSAVKASPMCNVDSLLNIAQHYAVVPYLYPLRKSGLVIRTKDDANFVAKQFYSPVNHFLTAVLGNNESGL